MCTGWCVACDCHRTRFRKLFIDEKRKWLNHTLFPYVFRLVKPCGIEVGVGSDTDSTSGGTSDPIQEHIISTWSDPVSETRSPTSSRASWTSHPWEDDEHWGDYQKYLGHNSSFAEEEEDEICLGESLWREWTRGPEEVCLFPSVWSEWTRTHSRRHGKARRSGGRRTTTKKNKKRGKRVPRHIRDRRRRRALRRKQLTRLAHDGGRRRRPPASFRGGRDPRDEDEQVSCYCECIRRSVGGSKVCSTVDDIPNELRKPTPLFLHHTVAFSRERERRRDRARW